MLKGMYINVVHGIGDSGIIFYYYFVCLLHLSFSLFVFLCFANTLTENYIYSTTVVLQILGKMVIQMGFFEVTGPRLK